MRWTLFLCLILPLGNTAIAACSMGPIQGIFYQPHAADLQVDSVAWETRIAALQRMGVQRMILQWTDYDDFDFIDAETSDQVDFLSLLGVLAERNGIELHIGLASDPEWFNRARLQGRGFVDYLRQLRSDALAQARQMTNLYPGLSFAGWYLPEEISDSDWQTQTRQALLLQHVVRLAHDLRSLKPDTSVTISSFASGAMSPQTYTVMLQSLLSTPGLSVLHQDGSGTGTLDSKERRDYLGHLSANLNNANWGVVVELFRQQSLPNEVFVARPATIGELTRQLDNRMNIDPRPHLTGFSLRYLLDDGSSLFDEYLDQYCRE